MHFVLVVYDAVVLHVLAVLAAQWSWLVHAKQSSLVLESPVITPAVKYQPLLHLAPALLGVMRVVEAVVHVKLAPVAKLLTWSVSIVHVHLVSSF